MGSLNQNFHCLMEMQIPSPTDWVWISRITVMIKNQHSANKIVGFKAFHGLPWWASHVLSGPFTLNPHLYPGLCSSTNIPSVILQDFVHFGLSLECPFLWYWNRVISRFRSNAIFMRLSRSLNCPSVFPFCHNYISFCFVFPPVGKLCMHDPGP